MSKQCLTPRQYLCQLKSYQTDRYAFLNEIFFDRIEELRSMQKKLHEIIENNTDDPEIQIKAIDQHCCF